MVSISRAFLAILLLFTLTPALLLPVVRVGAVCVDGRVVAVAISEPVNVTLAYVHSVELCEVVEVYLVYVDRLELAKVTWRGFGAGLPSSTEDLQYLRYRYLDGIKVVKGVAINVSTLFLQVKYMVSPRVLVNHREFYPRDYLALKVGVAASLVELALSLTLGCPYLG